MPFKDDASRYRNILECIGLIGQFIAGMDFEAYQRDQKTKSAVERQMLTISEAAKALGANAELLCPGHDWRGLRGMGDILRHAYHRVDDRLVWETAIRELPALGGAVQRTLSMLDGPPRT